MGRAIRAPHACMAVVVLSGLLLIPSSAGNHGYVSWVRQDAAGGTYLVGALNWAEGRGTIRWGVGQGNDGTGHAPAAHGNYISEPVPTTFFVNGSRLVELDLYTQGLPTSGPGSSCWGGGSTPLEIFAEVKAAGALLGGAEPGQKFVVKGSATGAYNPHTEFPSDPAGYGVCRIRFPAELAALPAGSTLTLTLQTRRGSTPLLGMSGDHESVIRIPVFSGNEVPFRYPTFGGPGAATPGVNRGGAGGLLGLGVGLSLPLALARPNRRTDRALLVAILSAGLAVAGCFEPTSRSLASQPDGVGSGSYEPSYQKGNLSAPGLGSLIGQVKASDTGAPLVSANVAVLGTGHGSKTDGFGTFTFKDLAEGSYRLRIDHMQYLSMEAEVRVRADLIARINVTMDPVGGEASSGVRPHAHDYWSGRDRIVLLDEYELDAYAFNIAPAEEEIHTILPGTYRVNVTLEWDRDPRRSYPARFQLSVQANNERSVLNETSFLPRGPGEPVHIVTAWEMSDAGHQRFSSWLFRIVPHEITPAPLEQQLLNAVDPPPLGIRVTVVIEKGSIPLEPGHPDLWGGGESVEIVRAEAARGGYCGGFGPCSNWDVRWIPTHVVPPETTWLEVHLNQSSSLAPYDLEFRYKTATAQTDAQCYNDNDASSKDHCEGAAYTKITIPGADGPSHVLTVRPTATEKDPFYAVRSFWIFALSPSSEGNEPTKAQAFGGVTATLLVIAHRGPVPS